MLWSERAAARRIGAIALAVMLFLTPAGAYGLGVWRAVGSPAGLWGTSASRSSGAAAGPISMAPADRPDVPDQVAFPASPPAGDGGSPTPETAGFPVATPAALGSLAPAPSSLSTPRPTAPAAPSLGTIRFSFEDGGTDGWEPHDHVTALANGNVAHDGTHSLLVYLYSSGATDFSHVDTDLIGMSAPTPGQTVTLFTFVPLGSTSMQGRVFVEDTSTAWHTSPMVGLAQGRWTKLSVSVPAGIVVTELGAQFLCTPFNTTGTVYIDSVSW